MAGFRFYKRFKIIPGVHLNLSRRGASLSAGVPSTGLAYHTDKVGFGGPASSVSDDSSSGLLYLIQHPVLTISYLFSRLLALIVRTIKGLAWTAGIIAALFAVASVIGLIRNMIG